VQPSKGRATAQIKKRTEQVLGAKPIKKQDLGKNIPICRTLPGMA
jgi:hypothetical protein